MSHLFTFQQQKDNNSATNETKEQQPPDDLKSSRDNVQVLGEDENVRAKPMEEMIVKVTILVSISITINVTLHTDIK